MKRLVKAAVWAWMGFLLLEGLILCLSWLFDVGQRRRDEVENKRACCRYLIARLDWALDEDWLRQSDYPAGIPELIVAQHEFFGTRNYESWEEIVDPWDRPLIYRVHARVHGRVRDGGFDLYSMGPNGIDERGAEDDIRNHD